MTLKRDYGTGDENTCLAHPVRRWLRSDWPGKRRVLSGRRIGTTLDGLKEPDNGVLQRSARLRYRALGRNHAGTDWQLRIGIGLFCDPGTTPFSSNYSWALIAVNLFLVFFFFWNTKRTPPLHGFTATIASLSEMFHETLML